MKWLKAQWNRLKAAGPLVKVALAAAIVLCSMVLLGGRFMIWNAQARLDDLRSQAGVLVAENQQLREDIDSLGSADSIRRIAAEILDLVDPDAVIIDSE